MSNNDVADQIIEDAVTGVFPIMQELCGTPFNHMAVSMVLAAIPLKLDGQSVEEIQEKLILCVNSDIFVDILNRMVISTDEIN